MGERTLEEQVKSLKAIIEPLGKGLQNGLAFQSSVQKLLSLASDVIHAQEETQKLLDATLKFLPKHFLKLLGVDDITRLKLGEYVELELTILFSDIRSYTNISEKTDHGELLNKLNEYLYAMGQAIHEHDGAIDKYIGDAIMAVFRNPNDALMAAAKMNMYLIKFNHDHSQDDPWQNGIGLHTGEVLLGTVGDGHRLSTTTLGDTVNIASRLENLTKKTEHNILFTDTVAKKVAGDPHLKVKKLGRARLKGKSFAPLLYTLQN